VCDNVTSSIGDHNSNVVTDDSDNTEVAIGDDNPHPNDVMDGDDNPNPNPNDAMDGDDNPNPNDVMDDNDNNEECKTHTRSGRQVRTPKRLIASNEWGQTAINYMSLSSAKQNYYTAFMTASSNEYMPYEVVNIGLKINELAAVGAGIGGVFSNTSELRVLKYKEAINGSDREDWLKAIGEEHERMVKNNVFKTVKRKNVPKGSKIITSTWACKKKANGTYRARLNFRRGYEQVDGEHYDISDIAAPVKNEMAVRSMLTIALMAGWIMHVIDVKGAFLLRDFEDNVTIYTEIPQGFKKWYRTDEVWLLLQTIYGTKQAAMAFWRLVNKVMKNMNFNRSTTDPCLFYKWTDEGLVVWLVGDDCLCIGPEKAYKQAVADMKRRFDCWRTCTVCRVQSNSQQGGKNDKVYSACVDLEFSG